MAIQGRVYGEEEMRSRTKRKSVNGSWAAFFSQHQVLNHKKLEALTLDLLCNALSLGEEV